MLTCKVLRSFRVLCGCRVMCSCWVLCSCRVIHSFRVLRMVACGMACCLTGARGSRMHSWFAGDPAGRWQEERPHCQYPYSTRSPKCGTWASPCRVTCAGCQTSSVSRHSAVRAGPSKWRSCRGRWCKELVTCELLCGPVAYIWLVSAPLQTLRSSAHYVHAGDVYV